MLIRKCDRCGKEYVVNSIKDIEAMYTVIKRPTNPLTDYDKPNDNRSKAMAWDICEKCIESFENWMKKTDISPVKIDFDKKVTFEDLHNEPINPFIEEEAERNERIALETQMNNAYARGNDRLGDTIAERLENESKSSSKVSKNEKTSGRPYTRLLKFKSTSSRDAFIYKYGKHFVPYPSFWYFKSHTRIKWDSTDEETIRKQLEKGYCVDPKNKLYVLIRIRSKQFKILHDCFYINHVGKANNDVEYIEK